MTPFPLAVVAALEDEIKTLRSRLSAPERLPLAGGRLMAGTWGGLPLLLVRTGVGKEVAGRTMRQVLDNFSLRLCLQVGYAGGARPELLPGDLIIATELTDAESGLNFAVAPESVAQADLIRRRLGLSGGCGPLLTVSQPALTPREKAAQAMAHRCLALEMEGAALAGACQAAGIPFLVVRAILDPLDCHLPESVRPRKNPLKSPPLSDYADRARRSLTAFTAAWIGDMGARL